MTDSGMNVRASASGSQSDNSMFHWIREGLNFAFDIPHTDKICVFGVEQCTVAGDFISNMADCVLDSPVAVVSDTRVPGWVGEGALSIILSTTGGSAEMIEIMDLLDSKGSELVCITPDGPIARRCTSSGGLVVPLPSDVTGFEAAGFCMGVLVSLVSEATGYDLRGAMQEAVEGAVAFIESVTEDYLKDLAVKLKDRVNAFYSTSDIHLDIRHVSAGCSSTQSFRTIAAGNAKCAFHGKIIVSPGAQKTEAYQESHSILLNENAKVETLPQLEIYADDVKCSHGATIGKLDENEIFYMRSRGIPEKQAREILLQAFVSPVIELIPESTEKEYIKQHVNNFFTSI